MLRLHQRVRAEAASLTAWCVQTVRYEALQGSFSKALDFSVPRGCSQCTQTFPPRSPLVLEQETCFPVAGSPEEASGCEIHKDGIGGGLAEDEGSQGDHEHPVADLGPPAVDTRTESVVGETSSTKSAGGEGSALPERPGFLDLGEFGLNQAEP